MEISGSDLTLKNKTKLCVVLGLPNLWRQATNIWTVHHHQCNRKLKNKKILTTKERRGKKQTYGERKIQKLDRHKLLIEKNFIKAGGASLLSVTKIFFLLQGQRKRNKTNRKFTLLPFLYLLPDAWIHGINSNVHLEKKKSQK